MSQDSDTGLTAAQLDAKYGESQDAANTPPRDDDDTPPAWLDEAAAMLNKPAGPPANNPPAAAPGAMAAALLPIRSESSQLVEQMGALAASAPSAAPDNKPAGPSQSGAPGGKPGDEDGDTSTDESEEEEAKKERLAESIRRQRAAESRRVCRQPGAHRTGQTSSRNLALCPAACDHVCFVPRVLQMSLSLTSTVSDPWLTPFSASG